MIYAIDFDGTLCDNSYPFIGEPKTGIIEFCKNLKAAGHTLVLWTCRSGEYLDTAVDWCNERGLRFDAVNDNLQSHIDEYGNNSRKVYADFYIDDKNLNIFTAKKLAEQAG